MMDQNNNRMVAYRAKKKKRKITQKMEREFKKIAGNEWTRNAKRRAEWKKLGEAQNGRGTI